MIIAGKSIQNYFIRPAEAVNIWLDRFVPLAITKPQQLHQACVIAYLLAANA